MRTLVGLSIVILLVATLQKPARSLVNQPVSEDAVRLRFSAIRLVLSQKSAIDLYKTYHGELTFSANDDLSHRHEVGDKLYCPGQVYVFAKHDREEGYSKDDSDLLFRWTVNVNAHIVGAMENLDVKRIVRESDEGSETNIGCVDGRRPVPLP